MPETRQYKVLKKRQSTSDVFLVDLASEHSSQFDFKPGQFAMLTIYDKEGAMWHKRPFSIASSPTNKEYLQFAVKKSGEFTQKLSMLEQGDKVGVAGPFGFCTFDEKKMKDIVFLVGGIGIAPYMSIIRYVFENKLPNKITLIYSNKTEKAVFYDELKQIAEKNENFNLIFTVTNNIPPFWKGEHGRIDESMIKKHCPLLKDKYFFLCGPHPFMDAMRSCLLKSSVPEEQIKQEKF